MKLDCNHDKIEATGRSVICINCGQTLVAWLDADCLIAWRDAIPGYIPHVVVVGQR